MLSRNHPFWLVGFRPFFTVACLAGAVFPLFWALIFTGVLAVPNAGLTPTVWHAHEMFYGFGWAVLGGFLLTSTKNWVSTRGYHGRALILLFVLWILERVAINAGAGWPGWLYWPAVFAYLVVIVCLLMWTLVRYRATDSYADNGFFWVLLGLFPIAKFFLIAGDFQTGLAMTLALFRLAFLLMLERTLTQFMKGVFQVTILRHSLLDASIKGLALMLVFSPFLPGGPVLAGMILLVALLLFRFSRWSPRTAFQRMDIGIMYVGYLAIVGQLGLEVLQSVVPLAWVGSVSVHLFTFGVMGCVIPAMIVRISRGHTGRKVVFETADKVVLSLMLLALPVRILLPQIGVSYTAVVHASATLWLLTFGYLGWRYVPLLLQPRVDGKEH